jgi:hypothetical protein
VGVPSAWLTRVVVPVARSQRKTSLCTPLPFVKGDIRFVASLSQAIQAPSALITWG